MTRKLAACALFFALFAIGVLQTKPEEDVSKNKDKSPVNDASSELVTTNPEEFELFLRGLSKDKNKECGSRTLSAVLRALSVSQPRSYIFIFTNGPATDYYLVKKVLEKVAEKQSQIVFVLGEQCAIPSHIGYQVYERIALHSSGQVLRIKKSDVSLALKFVEASVQTDKVHLLSVDSNSKKARSFTFLVDRHLKNIFVSTVGDDNVEVKLKHPEVEKAGHNTLSKIINKPNMVVTKVEHPQAGMWNITIKSTGNYTVRVSSESSFFVNYGFSTKKITAGVSTTKLDNRPVMDAKNFLHISFASKNKGDKPHLGLLKFVEVLKLNGEKIQTYPISLNALTDDSFVIEFVPPRDSFLLRFIGIDDKGDFARISPTVIDPKLPALPVVSMKEHYDGFMGQDLVLYCYVSSSVAFSITWSRDGVPLDNPTKYVQSVNTSLWIPPNAFGGTNKFTCSAKNVAGVASKTTTVKVRVAPPIIEEIGNKTALVGERIFLQCLAFSTEPITIKWFKNDREITTSDRYVITTDLQVSISDAKLEDSNWYFCVAENSGGKSVESFHLQVFNDPVVAVYPKIQGFRKGESFSLTCDTVGQYAPAITWLKDNKKLDMNPRIQRGPANELYISDALPSDQGQYTCKADYSSLRPNTVKEDSAIAEYRTPPEAKVMKSEYSAAVGYPVSLNCTASGNPRPTIAWNKNGVDVVDNNRILLLDNSLFILRAKLEDTGSYTCIAQNSEGLSFASTHLLVGSQPVIEKNKLRNVQADFGKNVTLQCSAKGIPAPYISWMDKRGEEIEKGDGVARLSSGKLLVSNVAGDDKFVCKAENDFGFAKAEFNIVTVGLEKPRIKSLPRDALTQVKVGSSVALPCDVTGKPRPTLKWVRRGGNFDLTDKRFQIHDDGTLFIKSITPKDSATYVCKVTNKAGSARAERKLLVTIPPVFDVKPAEEYQVFEGDELLLKCFATGIPRPQVSWKHNGRLLPEKQDTLVINEVNQKHNGTYKCIARNIAGKVSASTTVSIKEFKYVDVNVFEGIESAKLNQALEKRQIDILRFVQLPSDAAVESGQSHVFNCVAKGNPKPVVTWQRSGVDASLRLDILPNNSLILRNARPEDTGSYACIAENDRGKIMKEFTVMVIVNGGFSQWSGWGSCSASCGEGRQVRNRQCNSPAPRNGGRRCEGIYAQYKTCNLVSCQEEVFETPWSPWISCSRSCGGGRQYRIRPCQAGTANCPNGLQIENRLCNRHKCGGLPPVTEVIGSVSGEVNGINLQDIALMANISYVEDFVRISLDVKNIPQPLVYLLRSVASILVPIYWATVGQGRSDVNGISISKDSFVYDGKIMYNDVQVLSTKCLVSVIPGSRSLMMETSLSGDIQHFPRNGLSPQDYKEVFLQTSPSNIFGYSKRYFIIGQSSTAYTLTHSISYQSGKMMEKPAQIFEVKTKTLQANVEQRTVRHEIVASFIEGKDKCPSGYEKTGRFCKDINECETSTLCEQMCINTNGSYHCNCNRGFFLANDAVSCRDINECTQSFHSCLDSELCVNTIGGYECKKKDCDPGFVLDLETFECEDVNECLDRNSCKDGQFCVNTIGSYKCLWMPCRDGFERIANGTCIDRNECEDENVRSCNPMQICRNTYGSFKCLDRNKCEKGFTRDPQSMECEDVNECLLDVCKPNEFCMNTRGSFICFAQTCDTGFKNINGTCRDVNECSQDGICGNDQMCINTEGSFFCFQAPCKSGYKRVNGTCQDVDECANKPSPCPSGSLCINLIPSFSCILSPCKSGYSWNSETSQCQDIDECKEGLDTCKDTELCRNTFGKYECKSMTCEAGFEKNGNMDCVDIDECLKGTDKCKASEICENLEGSYICRGQTTEKPPTTGVVSLSTADSRTAYVRPSTTKAPTEDPRTAIVRTMQDPLTEEVDTGATSQEMASTLKPSSTTDISETVDTVALGTDTASVTSKGYSVNSAGKLEVNVRKTTQAVPSVTTNVVRPKTSEDSARTLKPDSAVLESSTEQQQTFTDFPFEPETEVAVENPTTEANVQTTQASALTKSQASVLTAAVRVTSRSTTLPTAIPLMTDDPNDFWWVYPEFQQNTQSVASTKTDHPKTKAVTLARTTREKVTKPPVVAEKKTDPLVVTEQMTMPPIETEEVTDPPVVTEKVTEPPVVTEKMTDPQVVTEQMTMPPIETEEVTDPPVVTEKVTQPPVVTEKMTDPQVVTEQMTMPPIETEEVTDPPLVTEKVTQPPVVTEQMTMPPIETGEVTYPPLATEKVTEPPVVTLRLTYPPLATEKVTEPPVVTLRLTDPPVVTEQMTMPPIETEEVTDPPVVTEKVTRPPLVTEKVTEPPVVTEQMTMPPIETEEVTDPPVVTEKVTEPPVVTEQITMPPIETEEVTDPPVVTEKVTEPPVVTQKVTDPPVVPDEVTDLPVVTLEATNPTTAERITEPPATTERVTDPPTTAEQVTEPPTTTERVTDPPTTAERVTEPPTTTERVTDPPTTAEQVTEPPTTTERVTDPPTTTKKVTEPPTTTERATEPPTTTKKVTEPPTTTERVTEPPTTTKKVTEPPTTTERVTEPPTTTKKVTEPPTTTERVTEPPTTTKKVTEPPTTTKKVTEPPTTAEKVTEPPTTTERVTEPLTTAERVTEPPTTIEKVTEPPTTTERVTEPPTTIEKVTEPPTTAEKVTEPPTTTERVTEPPTTIEKVTEPPTTIERVTEPPTTIEKVTEPPTTTERVTEPPTTIEKVTEPPTTAERVTEPPTTIEKVTEPPTTAKKVTEPPTTTERVTEPPATIGRVTEPPTTAERVTEPPTTTERVTEPPTTAETVTEPPTTAETVTDPPKPVGKTTSLPTTIIVKTKAKSTLRFNEVDKPSTETLVTDSPIVRLIGTPEVGNYICSFGYMPDRDGNCVDIDECAEKSHSCQEDQLCVNIEGGHRCACRRGFRMRDGDRKCVDINECRINLRLCQQDCVNTLGSYRCECRSGYILKADRRGCRADQNTKLSNLIGKEARVYIAKPYRCFWFMGVNMCHCPRTYKWNRLKQRCEKTVVIENSVKQDVLTPDPRKCFMFLRTKICKCPSDYKWNIKRQHCKLSGIFFDGNEVGLKEGAANVKESEFLTTIITFRKRSDTVSTTAAPIATTPDTCPRFFARNCDHKCRSVGGSYQCFCPNGYVKRYTGQCSDLNECWLGQTGCEEQGGSCFNTLGSFRCVNFTCPAGFLNYGRRLCKKPCTRKPASPRDICSDEYVSFHTFAIPRGALMNKRLVTLQARPSHAYVGQVQFYFVSGQSYFQLRKLGPTCIVYTRRNLMHPGNLDVVIHADIISARGQLVCRTVFKLYINVGKYRF